MHETDPAHKITDRPTQNHRLVQAKAYPPSSHLYAGAASPPDAEMCPPTCRGAPAVRRPPPLRSRLRNGDKPPPSRAQPTNAKRRSLQPNTRQRGDHAGQLRVQCTVFRGRQEGQPRLGQLLDRMPRQSHFAHRSGPSPGRQCQIGEPDVPQSPRCLRPLLWRAPVRPRRAFDGGKDGAAILAVFFGTPKEELKGE